MSADIEQDCNLCGRPIGDGDYVSGHRTCAICRSGGTPPSTVQPRCLRCKAILDPARDPAITTLGPRCRRCW